MANQPTPPVTLDVLSVEVRDPDTLLFSGNAISVSSRNSVGPFDVLPQHENFISLVSDKIVIFKDRRQKQEIPNTSAIIKAKQNRVTIFLGVETLSVNKQGATPAAPLKQGTAQGSAPIKLPVAPVQANTPMPNK